MPITHYVTKKLDINLEDENAQRSSDLILWKCGFDPIRFTDDYMRLRDRIDHFYEVLLRVGTIRTENDREDIRSAGVNLFVSVENFIEELVSYNVWILSSDHFVSTKFVYSRDAALSVVSTVLGSLIQQGDQEIQWKPTGNNTLGTLMGYADRCVKWMRDLLTADKTAFLRPTEDLPHYADIPHRPFPFAHTQLWCDAEPGELKGYADRFAEIVSQLQKSELASVRNGLDHMRNPEDFPSLETMLLCSTRLRQSVELADMHRYIPKMFWLESQQIDRYSREENVLIDNRGRNLTLGGPNVVLGIPGIYFGQPITIAPGNLIDEPNASLRFLVQEHSPYAEYWANYPRRRKITVANTQTELFAQTEDSI